MEESRPVRGAGLTFSWTDKTEWLGGNFFVVGHWDFKMPAHLDGDGQGNLHHGV